MGGRSGVRDEAQLQSVLSALARWRDSIALSGVEIYEGVLDNEASIRAFLDRAVDVTKRIAAMRLFRREPILLSGAGSAWYDVVAEVFSAAKFEDAVEVVLRPGRYLTHDVGTYRNAQTRILENNPVARQMNAGLEPALHIWAYVQSVPEARQSDRRPGQTRCRIRCRAAYTCASLPALRSCAEACSLSLDSDQNDGSARVSPHCASGRSARRRYDRLRHLASLPDLRQVAHAVGGERAVRRHGCDRDFFLIFIIFLKSPDKLNHLRLYGRGSHERD